MIQFEDLVPDEVRQGPPDFDDFWRKARAEAEAVVPDPRRDKEVRRTESHVYHQVSFTSTDGLRLGGWLAEPLHEPITRGIVHLHGYGGVVPVADVRPFDVPGAAQFYPNMRGLGPLSALPDFEPTSAVHVLQGIDSPDTYIHRACVQDAWVAVTALADLIPETAGHLDLAGASFGGGIGALALPLETRVKRASLYVPTFGNHPLRLEIPCTGSGEPVRLAVLEKPELRQTLAYFDAATAAHRITTPTIVCVAAQDPAVTEWGQLSVFEALNAPKALTLITAGHLEYDGQARDLDTMRASAAGWLCAP